MTDYSPVRAQAAQEAFEASARMVQERRKANPRETKLKLVSARKTEFKAEELYDAVFPPISYLVPEIIAQGVTLLTSPPKVGKSWLALDLSLAVQRGGEVLDGRKCAKGEVLYCALEDTQRRVQQRMKRLIAEPPAPGLEIWTSLPRLNEGGEERLRGWVQAQPNPRLIIIDVFAKVRSLPRASEGIYQADYRAIEPLKAIADEFGIAVVAIHHTRKAEAVDWMAMTSGSNGLTGAVDATVSFIRDGNFVTFCGRGRDIEEFELAVEFDKMSCRWKVLGDALEMKLGETRRAILAVLKASGSPLGPQKIAEVGRLSSGNVRVTIREMVKAGQLVKTARGQYATAQSP